MGYMDSYNYWITDAYFDEATKNELKAIQGNDTEIQERFYKDLEFGTGGLRGVLGAGTNRMNIYTVRRATQGLANYIIKNCGDTKDVCVVIAHDCRRMSPEFSREAALVLNGNGIKSYVFDSLRPTPLLSFAVRYLGAVSGIVITASHNPPEYNGYKAYWSDGGQIPYPYDEEIIKEVEKIEQFSQIKLADMDEAVKNGLYNVAGPDVDDAFIKSVISQSVNPEMVRQSGGDLTIVYTPLNGTGNKPVRRVLNEMGFSKVYVVPEQEQPDGSFPTVAYPNPEDPKAFKLAMKLADEVSADIIIGTDPDSDRMGAVIKDASGEYVVLSGNMTGVLLTEYILSQKKANGTLPENAAVISTIVSTDLTKVIAAAYGADYFDVLTGFKYIGEKIKLFEETGSNTYVFGFEESYGYLAGTHARDKDAVVASMLICELVVFYKNRGMTLYDGLMEIYEKYGYYKEINESITLKGIEGVENIRKIMAALREQPPVSVGGLRVVESRDYKNSVSKRDGVESKLTLPVSDVLYYVLEDGTWFCVRPSGTEPKIKIYFGAKGGSMDEADAKLAGVARDVREIIK